MRKQKTERKGTKKSGDVKPASDIGCIGCESGYHTGNCTALPGAYVDLFTSPESSTVVGGTYAGEDRIVVMAFQDKRKAGAPIVYYSYANVSAADWQDLKNAESKGKAMEWFKRKYVGVKQE